MFYIEVFSLLFISCWCCAVVARGFCAEPPPSRLMMSCVCESSQNKRSLRRRRLKSFSLFRLWIYSPPFPSTHPTDCGGGCRLRVVLLSFFVTFVCNAIYLYRRPDRMCDTRERGKEKKKERVLTTICYPSQRVFHMASARKWLGNEKTL